jgi:hypothetical protein
MYLPLIKQSEIADQTEKEQQSEQCRLRSKGLAAPEFIKVIVSSVMPKRSSMFCS